MARTDSIKVKAVNGSTLDDSTIQVFIDTATLLIDGVQTCANVSDEQLIQAETYLTCHLMEHAQAGGGVGIGSIKSETIETMKTDYERGASGGIKSTNYGMIADTLVNGCLSKSELRRAAVGFTGGA
jgi:hypothetical protein